MRILSQSRRQTSSTGPPQRRATVPRLERLEDRTLLSPLMVLNNNDSGTGSLRQAILDASSGATIKFESNVNDITLTSGELAITKNLDIEGPGPGANRLTISGGGVSRVFKIGNGATVTLANLTIANGHVDNDGGRRHQE